MREERLVRHAEADQGRDLGEHRCRQGRGERRDDRVGVPARPADLQRLERLQIDVDVATDLVAAELHQRRAGGPDLSGIFGQHLERCGGREVPRVARALPRRREFDRSARADLERAVGRDEHGYESVIALDQTQRDGATRDVDPAEPLARIDRPQLPLGGRLGRRRFGDPGPWAGTAQLIAPSDGEQREQPGRQHGRAAEGEQLRGLGLALVGRCIVGGPSSRLTPDVRHHRLDRIGDRRVICFARRSVGDRRRDVVAPHVVLSRHRRRDLGRVRTSGCLERVRAGLLRRLGDVGHLDLGMRFDVGDLGDQLGFVGHDRGGLDRVVGRTGHVGGDHEIPAGMDQIGVGEHTTVVERPTLVRVVHLRPSLGIAEFVIGDRPQRLAALDDVRPGLGAFRDTGGCSRRGRQLEHPADVEERRIVEVPPVGHLSPEVQLDDLLGVRTDRRLLGTRQALGDAEHRVTGAHHVLAATGLGDRRRAHRT